MRDNAQAPWAEKSNSQPSQAEDKDRNIGLVGFEVEDRMGLSIRAGFQDAVLSLLIYLCYLAVVMMCGIGTTGWHGIDHGHLPRHRHHARRRHQHE